MSVSSVSDNGSILKEEYLEQRKQLRQQQTVIDSERSANAAKTAQSDGNADSRVNADTSGSNQATSPSGGPAKAAGAGRTAPAATGSDTTSNQTLINKANSGSELSASELSTLRQVDPALYARVVKAQKAREEARSQMSETPSNAARVMKDVVSANASEDDETQNLIERATFDEYRSFASRYDQVIISGRQS
ncbi:MAG: hypothetical protein LBQ90_12730 [Synergistaceae bacterium]|jgi:hypothetical protein|nr:hypothetical protein [Synergistaceae bacterium]